MHCYSLVWLKDQAPDEAFAFYKIIRHLEKDAGYCPMLVFHFWLGLVHYLLNLGVPLGISEKPSKDIKNSIRIIQTEIMLIHSIILIHSKCNMYAVHTMIRRKYWLKNARCAC